MRLSATTAAATTTRIKPETNPKQTLEATTATTTAATARQTECFICNLIQLFILTTTIVCTASAMGSGLLQVQAQVQPTRQRSEELPTDYDSSMLAAAAVSAEAAIVAAAAAAAATMTTAGLQLSTHTPTQTLQLATTLRAGYGKQLQTNYIFVTVHRLSAANCTTQLPLYLCNIFMSRKL